MYVCVDLLTVLLVLGIIGLVILIRSRASGLSLSLDFRFVFTSLLT